MICIDAEKLMLKDMGNGAYIVTEESILNARTLEAEPVKHGHWINAGHDEWSHYIRCSACGKLFANASKTKYCSDCGARMDGKESENEQR